MKELKIGMKVKPLLFKDVPNPDYGPSYVRAMALYTGMVGRVEQVFPDGSGRVMFGNGQSYYYLPEWLEVAEEENGDKESSPTSYFSDVTGELKQWVEDKIQDDIRETLVKVPLDAEQICLVLDAVRQHMGSDEAVFMQYMKGWK